MFPILVGEKYRNTTSTVQVVKVTPKLVVAWNRTSGNRESFPMREFVSSFKRCDTARVARLERW